MKKIEYLQNILENKYITPRYCKEDIKHLTLSLNGKPFDEVAVLQKCFCDIPLHKITNKLRCSVRTQKKDDVLYEEKDYSHTDLYGEYAIALTKSWGERKGVQPVHYINENSFFLKNLAKL